MIMFRLYYDHNHIPEVDKVVSKIYLKYGKFVEESNDAIYCSNPYAVEIVKMSSLQICDINSEWVQKHKPNLVVYGIKDSFCDLDTIKCLAFDPDAIILMRSSLINTDKHIDLYFLKRMLEFMYSIYDITEIKTVDYTYTIVTTHVFYQQFINLLVKNNNKDDFKSKITLEALINAVRNYYIKKTLNEQKRKKKNKGR